MRVGPRYHSHFRVGNRAGDTLRDQNLLDDTFHNRCFDDNVFGHDFWFVAGRLSLDGAYMRLRNVFDPFARDFFCYRFLYRRWDHYFFLNGFHPLRLYWNLLGYDLILHPSCRYRNLLLYHFRLHPGTSYWNLLGDNLVFQPSSSNGHLLLDHFGLQTGRLNRYLLRNGLRHKALLRNGHLLVVGLVLHLSKILTWRLIWHPSKPTPLIVWDSIGTGAVAASLPTQMIANITGLNILLSDVTAGVYHGWLVRGNWLVSRIILRLISRFCDRSLDGIVLSQHARLCDRTLNNLLLSLHRRFGDGSLNHEVLSLIDSLCDRFLHDDMLGLVLSINDWAHRRHDLFDLRRFVDIGRLVDIFGFDYLLVDSVGFVSRRGLDDRPLNRVLSFFNPFLHGRAIANNFFFKHSILVLNAMQSYGDLLKHGGCLQSIRSNRLAALLRVQSIASQQCRTRDRNRRSKEYLKRLSFAKS